MTEWLLLAMRRIAVHAAAYPIRSALCHSGFIDATV
jgi:hypothetical protein